MRCRKLALSTLAAVALAIAAQPASAIQLVNPDGSAATSLQNLANQSKVRTADVRVIVYRGVCPGLPNNPGCLTSTNPYTMHLWRSLQGTNLRYGLMHELGHVWDYSTMTDWQRLQFMLLNGYNIQEWWAGNPSDGELFADAYANCAASLTYNSQTFYSGYGWDPTRTQYANVCATLKK